MLLSEFFTVIQDLEKAAPWLQKVDWWANRHELYAPKIGFPALMFTSLPLVDLSAIAARDNSACKPLMSVPPQKCSVNFASSFIADAQPQYTISWIHEDSVYIFQSFFPSNTRNPYQNINKPNINQFQHFSLLFLKLCLILLLRHEPLQQKSKITNISNLSAEAQTGLTTIYTVYLWSEVRIRLFHLSRNTLNDLLFHLSHLLESQQLSKSQLHFLAVPISYIFLFHLLEISFVNESQRLISNHLNITIQISTMAAGRGGYNTPASTIEMAGRGGYNGPLNFGRGGYNAPVDAGRGGYNDLIDASGRGGYNRGGNGNDDTGRGGYNWATSFEFSA